MRDTITRIEYHSRCPPRRIERKDRLRSAVHGGNIELPEEDLLVIGDDKEVSTSMLPAITEGRATTIMPSPQQPVLDFAEG